MAGILTSARMQNNVTSTNAPQTVNGRPWQEAQQVDRMPLPSVYLFSGKQGSYTAYRHGNYDAALRHDPQFAETMLYDPHLQSLIRERVMATATKRWQVIIGDSRNPVHKAISSSVQRIIEETPRFMVMTEAMLHETIFKGRAGTEILWEPKLLEIADPDNPEQMVVRDVDCITRWFPINGDKIGHLYDGTTYILVNSAMATHIPDAQLTTTTAGGRGLLVKGTWRRNFILHQHQVRDASYYNSDQADSIHGIGERNTLFWIAWLKKQLLADILEFCERTGLGLRVWKYQAGNPQSEEEAKRAAATQTDRTNVVVPVFAGAGGRPLEGVEFVETGASGANIFQGLIAIFDDWQERLMIGQTLSSDTEGSGLGGTGVAAMHMDTKFQLTSFDAVNMGETYSLDLAKPILSWTYPRFKYLPCRFEYALVSPNPMEILTAASTYYELGGSIIEDELRQKVGFTEPRDGDKTLSLANAMQQQQQMMAQQQPQPGQQQPGENDYASVLSALTKGAGSGNQQGEPSTAIA